MKTINKTVSILAVAFIALTSCVHKGDLEIEPVPDIAFDYTSEGLTLTFTSQVEGTSNISWNIIGQDGATGTGETFTYTFPQPGNYWVQMTGTYGGREQVFSGKILVAKPSVVKLDDESFEDWDNVNYSDFMLVATAAEGGANVGSGKIYYDSNYFYFYVDVETSLPSANAEQMILTMSIDADNNAATGLANGSMGVEWLLEGNFWAGGWASWYDSSSGENVEDATKADSYILGTYLAENDRMQLEFAMSRKDFEMTGSSITMSMKFYNEDWNNAILITCDGKDAFPVAMDKLQ